MDGAIAGIDSVIEGYREESRESKMGVYSKDRSTYGYNKLLGL